MKKILFVALASLAMLAHAGYDDALDDYRAHRYEQALTEFLRLSTHDHHDAEFMLALMYANGDGVARDPAKAIYFAERLASAGRADGFSIIGSMYGSSKSGVRDLAKSIAWYQRGVDAKETNSMRFLSKSYSTGVGVPRDPVRAFELMKMAAERKTDYLANYELGKMYERGQGVPADAAKARAQYLLGKNDDPRGFLRLAAMLERNPAASPADLERARGYYESAAKRGSGAGMDRLGLMWAEGRGGAQDYALAARWFEHAADSGNADGLYHGAMLFARGNGVKQSDTEAMAWLQEAVSHGQREAMVEMVRRQEDGRGVAASAEAARQGMCVALVADGARSRREAAVDTPLMPAVQQTLAAVVRALDHCGNFAPPAGPAIVQLRAALAKRLPAAAAAAAAAPGMAMQPGEKASTFLEAARWPARPEGDEDDPD